MHTKAVLQTRIHSLQTGDTHLIEHSMASIYEFGRAVVSLCDD